MYIYINIYLTCITVDTRCRSCYIRVFACATPTCISTASSAALCPSRTAGMHSGHTFAIDKSCDMHQYVQYAVLLHVACQYLQYAHQLQGHIRQASGPSHDTTQSNNQRLLLADAYVYCGRVSSSYDATRPCVCGPTVILDQSTGTAHSYARNIHTQHTHTHLHQTSLRTQLTRRCGLPLHQQHYNPFEHQYIQ